MSGLLGRFGRQMPQVQYRVGTPWAPGLRAGFGGAFAQALAFAQYLLQHQVASGEGIGHAHRPQRHVMRSPRADAGDGGGLLDEMLQCQCTTEIQAPPCAGPPHRAPRAGKQGRQAPRASQAEAKEGAGEGEGEKGKGEGEGGKGKEEEGGKGGRGEGEEEKRRKEGEEEEGGREEG